MLPQCAPRSSDAAVGQYISIYLFEMFSGCSSDMSRTGCCCRTINSTEPPAGGVFMKGGGASPGEEKSFSMYVACSMKRARSSTHTPGLVSSEAVHHENRKWEGLEEITFSSDMCVLFRCSPPTRFLFAVRLEIWTCSPGSLRSKFNAPS